MTRRKDDVFDAELVTADYEREVRAEVNEVPGFVRQALPDRTQRRHGDNADEQRSDCRAGHIRLATGGVLDRGPVSGAALRPFDDPRDHMDAEHYCHGFAEITMPDEHLVEAEGAFQALGAGHQENTNETGGGSEQAGELRNGC